MDDVQWVMASSQAQGMRAGGGRRVTLNVYQDGSSPYLAGPWRWTCEGTEYDPRDAIASGRGYLSPDDARAAAEAWLATYRAHNEAMAKEGEGES